MVENVKEKNSCAGLKGLLNTVLSKTARATKAIHQIQELAKHKEGFCYTWKLLMIKLEANKESCDIFMLNVLDLVEMLGGLKSTLKIVIDLPSVKKYVRKVWESLINRDLSTKIHKKLLFVLLESYLSKIDNPLFLTDFLMASTNVKGVISILALQGVATLMQKHNIEYPNIYGKLYVMLEPSIFHSKFKSRWFYLADIFLSSSHLPKILVASFVKRASRLSLLCAASDIRIILRFVGNLLLRHTGLIKMIHSSNDFDVDEDPFSADENDPMKTCATESSLWEIALLKNHCQPSVSLAAKFIDSNLPSVEFDLSGVLSNTYETMFNTECKKKKPEPSLTFERPRQTVAKFKTDRIFNLWSLTK